MSWEHDSPDSGSETEQSRLTTFTDSGDSLSVLKRVLSPRVRRLLVAVIGSIGLFHLILSGDFYTAVATGIGTSILFEVYGVSEIVERVAE